MLLHHLLERTAARTPHQEALVFEAQRLSYANINLQARSEEHTSESSHLDLSRMPSSA